MRINYFTRRQEFVIEIYGSVLTMWANPLTLSISLATSKDWSVCCSNNLWRISLLLHLQCGDLCHYRIWKYSMSSYANNQQWNLVPQVVLSHLIVNENTFNKQVLIRQSPTLIACICPPSVLTVTIVSCRYVEAVLPILKAAASAATSCYFTKASIYKINYFWVVFTASFSPACPGSLLWFCGDAQQ